MIRLVKMYNDKIDAYGMIFPLIFMLALTMFFHETMIDENGLVYLLIFKIVINQWHVLLSLFLSLEHQKILNFAKDNIYLVLISIFGLSVVALFNVKLFMILFGYFGLYHIIMQAYGLLKIGHKNSTDIFENKLTLLLFWAMIFLSLLYWFQGSSFVGPHYMVPNNIPQFSQIISPIFIKIISIVLAAIYILNLIFKMVKKQEFNLGLFYVMLGVFLVFVFGLVLAKSNNLFYILSFTFHGVTYSAHVYYAKTKASNGLFVTNYKALFASLVCAILWSIVLETNKTNESLYSVIYIPLIAHFVFDGYFWKKNRYAQYV